MADSETEGLSDVDSARESEAGDKMDKTMKTAEDRSFDTSGPKLRKILVESEGKNKVFHVRPDEDLYKVSL